MRKIIVAAVAAALAVPAFAQLKMPAQKPPPGETSKPRDTPRQQSAQPDPAVIERMFGCLAPGLPKDWKRTWVTVTAETPGAVPGKFQIRTLYATDMADKSGQALKPCGWDPFVEGFLELNQGLAEDRRAWKTARLTITSEGKFELTYDY